MNPNTKELLACLARRIALAQERDKDQADYTIERLTLAAVEVLRYELERAKFMDTRKDSVYPTEPRDIEQYEQEGDKLPPLVRVKIVADVNDHEYVIPADLRDEFRSERLDKEALTTGAFEDKWRKYAVNGRLSVPELYARIS